MAHAVHTTFPMAQVHYRLIDAIPSVMVLATQHMRNLLGENDVALLLDDDAEVAESKVEIIPAWHTGAIRKVANVDVIIIIESFQEMSSEFVKFWFDFAEGSIAADGIFYISNSRSYINLAPWPIPSGWIVNFQLDIPRMWTLDHPTAVASQSVSRYPERYGELMRRGLSSVWKNPGHMILPVGTRAYGLFRFLKGLNSLFRRPL